MLRGVRSLLGDAGFQIALVVAVAGTVVVASLARVVPPRHVGFAVVSLVAAFVTMRVDLELTWRLVVGVLILTVANRGDESRRFELARFAALVAGAALVTSALPGAAGWMRFLAFATLVAAVPATGIVDRRAPRLVPVLLLVSAVGVYICAPDTEYSKVLIGALVPAAFLAFDPRLRAARPTGAVTALVVWTAVYEGRGRPGAVIGGLLCLGVLLLVPLTRWRWRSAGDAIGLAVLDVALVLYVARIAGFRTSGWAALALALPAFVLAWLALLVTRPRA
jgi:hypothetical protein